MSTLALDLGGTKLAVATFSPEGSLLSSNAVPLEKRGGSDVGQLIRQVARQYLQADHMNIHSIGVSVPGISRKSGTVWAPNIAGWDDYPLLAEIQTETSLPVVIESDRTCCILGESWQGNARGCKDAIYLAVGTGIGAGILTGSRILRGAHDIAGSIGWMGLQRPFDKKYVPCGCFEYYASGEGIARLARELVDANPSYDGPLNFQQEITARHIFEAYEDNDRVATMVMKEFIELWGMAVANLISIFNPEKIIFGGGVFGPAVQFLPQIIEYALKWAQPISAGLVSIEKSGLGDNAAIYGAGYLGLTHHEQR